MVLCNLQNDFKIFNTLLCRAKEHVQKYEAELGTLQNLIKSFFCYKVIIFEFRVFKFSGITLSNDTNVLGQSKFDKRGSFQ